MTSRARLKRGHIQEDVCDIISNVGETDRKLVTHLRVLQVSFISYYSVLLITAVLKESSRRLVVFMHIG